MLGRAAISAHQLTGQRRRVCAAGPVVRSNPNGSCVEFVGRIDGGVPVKSSYCY
jgi:hypothetical protein